jgi:hypothetical protein
MEVATFSLEPAEKACKGRATWPNMAAPGWQATQTNPI